MHRPTFDNLIHPLRAHDRYIDLSGAFAPGSIRDQMLRAQWIVDRIVDAGWCGLGRPLLIIGAGTTGVSAAIAAAHYGQMGQRIPVNLIDHNTDPFSRQKDCTSRRIDPNGYDWPANSWHENQVLHAPLPLSNLRVDQQHAVWLQHWRKELAATDTITWYPRHTVSPQIEDYDKVNELWTVTLHSGRHTVPLQAGAILDCRGWGQELTHFGKSETEGGNHRSIPFWQDDTLTAPNCGLTGQSPRILIAGGGDGALQDFARAATGLDAPQLCHLFRNDQAALPPELLRELEDAARHAAHSLQFANATQREEVLHDLHDAHLALLVKLQSCTELYARITTIVRQQARPWLSEEGACLHLAFGQSYLGACYPINHFIALLLQAILPQTLTFLPAQRVVKANCLGNHALNAEDCLGIPTDVTVQGVDANGNPTQEVRRGFNNSVTFFSNSAARSS